MVYDISVEVHGGVILGKRALNALHSKGYFEKSCYFEQSRYFKTVAITVFDAGPV